MRVATVRERRTAKARSLRQPMPQAEFVFWRAVQNRQLDGFKSRRQQLVDRFFADFACVSAKLVVELDGLPTPTAKLKMRSAPRLWSAADGG